VSTQTQKCVWVGRTAPRILNPPPPRSPNLAHLSVKKWHPPLSLLHIYRLSSGCRPELPAGGASRPSHSPSPPRPHLSPTSRARRRRAGSPRELCATAHLSSELAQPRALALRWPMAAVGGLVLASPCSSPLGLVLQLQNGATHFFSARSSLASALSCVRVLAFCVCSRCIIC
jgi:hypothetical protein